MGGELRQRIGGLEAHVVVAVRRLRLAARIDHVDLRRDLISGAEPGLAHQRDRRVPVIAREQVRIAEAQLLQRVPDPVVGAGLGEMVAGIAVAGAPLLDHDEETVGRRVDHGEVGERVLE